MGPPEGSATPRAHLGIALAVISTAQLMVMLDLTIVNIALPSIRGALHFSTVNLQWVITAYVLVFGGFLLLGGRLGDLFGRRRLFLVGIAIFTAASLAGGFATDQAWLLTTRALQGVGAAIASPTALALVATTFADGPRRQRAMAVYAGMSGAGAALGLLLGGVLTDIGSWRWVMFVNVPIGVTLLITARLVLPAANGRSGQLDLPGALSASGGLALLVYGLSRAATSGWSNSITLAAFVLSAILIATFVAIEARSTHPLLPLWMLANRNRAGGYAVMLVFGGVLLSVLFFLTQYLQDVRGYSPIVTGVAFLPMPMVVALVGVGVARLVRVIGTRPPLTIGPLVVAGGLWWLSHLRVHGSYLSVLEPLLVFAVGMGLSFVPLTLNAVAAVRPQESGLAAALLNTSQQVGGSIGLAVLVTISAAASARRLTSLTVGATTTATTHATTADHLLATVAGFNSGFQAAAMAAVAAFVVALVTVRRSTRPQASGSVAALESGPVHRVGKAGRDPVGDGPVGDPVDRPERVPSAPPAA